MAENQPDGLQSQEDIDAMLSGGADQPAPEAADEAATPAPADDGGGAMSQADIDAALAGGGAEASTAEPEAVESQTESGPLTQDDINAALAQAGLDASVPGASAPVEAKTGASGQAFDEVAAAMEAAVASEAGSLAAEAITPAVEPKPFDIPSLQGSDSLGQASSQAIDLLRDVDLNVKIELGRSKMLVDDVLKLGEGSVVELDKLAGDPVDVLVNDRLVARGEVLVLNDNFCVRVNEIVSRELEEDALT